MKTFEDVEQLLFKKIDDAIDFLRKENSEIIFIKSISLEEFETYTDKEKSDLAGDLDKEKAREEIEKRMNKKIQNNNIKYINNPDALHYDLRRELDKYFLDVINERIAKENEELKKSKNEVRSSIHKLEDLKNELKKSKIDLEKLLQLSERIEINNREDLKQALIYYGTTKNQKYEEEKKKKEEEKRKLEEEKKKLEEISKEKEEIVEEKLFDIKNYDYIKELIIEYESILPNSVYNTKIEEVFSDNKDLIDILKIHYSELDDELFKEAFISLLSKIDKSRNKETIEIYTGNLIDLCKKFELKNNVDFIEEQIKALFSLDKLNANDTKELTNLQNNAKYIKENTKLSDEEINVLLNNMFSEIHKIKSNKLQEKLDESEKVEIKSFILFNYKINEKKQKVPYIITDLDENSTKCQIDKSIDRSKLDINGYIDFDNLIDELLNYGKLLIIDKTDKLDKYICPVYHRDNSHSSINKSMKKATGMYRTRPKIMSNVRFIDEEFRFKPNTEKFNQIIGLLEEKIPNIQIDKNQPFSLYINYLDAFKKIDTDSYSTAENRQEKSILRQILKKEKFEKKDLYELSDVIDKTLNAYEQLKEINSNFEFKIIDKITQENVYTP